MGTRGVIIAITVLWAGFHLLYGNTLIAHDSFVMFPFLGLRHRTAFGLPRASSL
jgi:hypothetical protein